jgi:hypothetical protein
MFLSIFNLWAMDNESTDFLSQDDFSFIKKASNTFSGLIQAAAKPLVAEGGKRVKLKGEQLKSFIMKNPKKTAKRVGVSILGAYAGDRIYQKIIKPLAVYPLKLILTPARLMTPGPLLWCAEKIAHNGFRVAGVILANYIVFHKNSEKITIEE